MTKRALSLLFLYTILSFGVYFIVWLVATKEELNARGAAIPSAWVILFPLIGSFYFLWKYAEGVAKVTNGKTPHFLAFLLFFIPLYGGAVILQNKYNEM